MKGARQAILFSMASSAALIALGYLYTSNAPDAVAFLAPGYILFIYLHDFWIGPSNVHLDVGGMVIFGFALNTLIWYLILSSLRYGWNLAKRPKAG